MTASNYAGHSSLDLASAQPCTNAASSVADEIWAFLDHLSDTRLQINWACPFIGDIVLVKDTENRVESLTLITFSFYPFVALLQEPVIAEVYFFTL